MTLEEATEHALSAARNGDLREVARALEAREAAIAQAVARRQPPPPACLARIVEGGERLAAALRARRRELALEAAWVQQLQARFPDRPARATRISLRG